MFPDFHEGILKSNPFANGIRMAPQVCVGPIRHVGHDILQRSISNLVRANRRKQDAW
jgi:hypothetical protein